MLNMPAVEFGISIHEIWSTLIFIVFVLINIIIMHNKNIYLVVNNNLDSIKLIRHSSRPF